MTRHPTMELPANLAAADPAVAEFPGISGPADEHLAERLVAARRWQPQLQQLQRESPSLLFSLVIHLVFFLMITSIASPLVSKAKRGSGRISLQVGFSQATRPDVGPEVSVIPLSAPSPSESAPVEVVTTDAAPIASDAGKRQPPADRIARRKADYESVRSSPYAALLNRHRPTPAVTAPTTRLLQPITEPTRDARQQEVDQIVDDFIAYDIGQLRGIAGQQARQRFATLGPEAVPALVRGLNKAAGIHASCPVGVIAGKLIMTLRGASDPSLRQYAIDHIGVGVPESAPHYQRLLALRKHWLDAPELPPNVAVVVDRLDVRQEGELMELMLALSESPSDTLVAALKSGDEYLAAAATLAIIQARQSWTTDQRAQLRAAVVFFRAMTEKSQLRSLADDAERSLRGAG